VFRVFPVCGGVTLGGLGGVVLGLRVMAMRQMGMVSRLFVIALFVVLGGSQMVLGGLLMVLRGVAMMIGLFLRHGKSSLWGNCEALAFLAPSV
jgi:hypothetical protein